MSDVIRRGGADTERLYLQRLKFSLETGETVIVEQSAFPGIDMADVVARHKGRYSLLGLFCRPGYRVLDFPCGSGYAATILLREFGVEYCGLERDPITVEYARELYGSQRALFDVGDLCSPPEPMDAFDTIGCIEGLEHIEQQYQSPLIAALARALKSGGTLVVSSPENPTGKSGRSAHNKDHLWELTRDDFLALLWEHFPKENVELVTHKAVISTGVLTTCFYGICHK